MTEPQIKFKQYHKVSKKLQQKPNRKKKGFVNKEQKSIRESQLDKLYNNLLRIQGSTEIFSRNQRAFYENLEDIAIMNMDLLSIVVWYKSQYSTVHTLEDLTDTNFSDDLILNTYYSKIGITGFTTQEEKIKYKADFLRYLSIVLNYTSFTR